MKTDLITIEAELKKRLNEPLAPWGRKQSDEWDRATQFIYDTWSWSRLKRLIANDPQPLQNYAVNRWFNYWSARGVEQIFCQLPAVKAAKNPKDRLVDFSIKGIPFDHKTTVFPKSYPYNFGFAFLHPDDLAKWLYFNQSKQRRYHTANRLFLVLYDHSPKREHWKLRAELSKMEKTIQEYLTTFSPSNLITLDLGYNNIALTDILWITRNGL